SPTHCRFLHSTDPTPHSGGTVKGSLPPLYGPPTQGGSSYRRSCEQWALPSASGWVQFASVLVEALPLPRSRKSSSASPPCCRDRRTRDPFMDLYNDYILPHVIDLSMRNRELLTYRKALAVARTGACA